jgi:hypothetical protein
MEVAVEEVARISVTFFVSLFRRETFTEVDPKSNLFPVKVSGLAAKTVLDESDSRRGL